MQNMGRAFQGENISFAYSTEWREQDPKLQGKSCIKHLIFIENNLQNVLMINKYINRNKESMTEFLESSVNNFRKQGWNVLKEEVESISGIDSVNIITSAINNDKEYQLHIVFLFYEDFMYVFELTTFPKSKKTIKEFHNIINSIIFQ